MRVERWRWLETRIKLPRRVGWKGHLSGSLVIEFEEKKNPQTMTFLKLLARDVCDGQRGEGEQ